jgi:hypothetical protein
MFRFAVGFEGDFQIAPFQNGAESRRSIRAFGDSFCELIEDVFTLPRLIDIGLVLVHRLSNPLVDLIESKIGQKQKPQQNANDVEQADSSHARYGNVFFGRKSTGASAFAIETVRQNIHLHFTGLTQKFISLTLPVLFLSQLFRQAKVA